MSLIYNATFDKNTRKLSFEDRAGNEIYSFIVPERVTVDDITKPLTFKAIQDGSTVKLTKYGSPDGSFQMSMNGGKTWVDYTIDTYITLNTGDKVSFRARYDREFEQRFGAYFYFEMTGKIEAWHNVMSLYSVVVPSQKPMLGYAFFHMFKDCTSLTKTPILPATTLADQCYRDMFNGCTSLTEAPELPATTLTYFCYAGMFNGCTSLVNAPVLPVTTLAEYCYFWMFSNCTSLVKAPELPATTLANNCYTSMFYGCSSLNEVRCKMPPTIIEEDVPKYTGDGSDSSMVPWLEGVSETGTFYTNADANWTSGASGIPTSWTRVPKRPVDDIAKPLTFKAIQDGSTVKLTKAGTPSGSFQTSRDGGNTWADYTLDTAIPLNTGEEVSFRAKADHAPEQGVIDYFYFEMTGKIEAWNNVMSMIRTNDFATYNATVSYAFYNLFSGCASLTKAPVLPATTLAQNCYESMFQGCTSLTKAPELPATTLNEDCYNGMFSGCNSLTKAPELPATSPLPHCYQYMFNGCTSLTKAPELPATTLAQYCYAFMFRGCTSLVEAPVLPATTLTVRCYSNMFEGCTSLTKAPELPATTLANNCYSGMFNGCSSLNEVRCKMSSTISAEDISSTYAKSWLSGVASTGTFYTNADANWSSGASGIPEGWTRFNEEAPAVDDIAKPLMFRATQNGSVRLTAKGSPTGSFETSTDGGNTWKDYTLGTSVAINTGYGVYFRAKADRTSGQTSKNYFYFTMTGKIEAWHNVMSLYRTNDFATYNTAGRSEFYHLFDGCTSLTKSPVLPATTLGERCYSNMFLDCTSLTEAPVLPTTTLAPNCYQNMFKRCTSLAKAPELPATTLATSCYFGMFYGCSSLNEVHCKMPPTIIEEDVPKYTGSGETAWLSGVASTGTFYTNADANWTSGSVSGIPTGWTRVNEGAPTVDDIKKPLTFRATQNGSTVSLTKNGDVNGDFQTSRDGGNTWTDYTIGTAVTLNTGGEVSFRAKSDREFEQSDSKYFQFNMTGKIEAWHNVMSLYRTNDFSTYESVVEYGFSRLFEGCTSLVKAPVLPATTLALNCYRDMFNGCTSLTEAPDLPATTLAVGCYYGMFKGCTSLTKAPELPATTLADSCYRDMFNGCISLVNAPALPATTLANYCYQSMFYGCTSLAEAPVLPATTLADYCYQNMFKRCTSLAKAPELPATTLATSCYEGMFWGCTSLVNAPKLPATTLKAGCYEDMFYGCTSLKEAPELPATTLSYRCYVDMFSGCTSLANAPRLPATTLNEDCYFGMFGGCTSLTKAPELPATTLAVGCYQHMFEGCDSLTKAPALPATTLAVRCYQFMFGGCSWLNEVHCNMPSSYSSSTIEKTYAYSWLGGVAQTGTFYTNADANWPSGASGIPEGWTRVNA